MHRVMPGSDEIAGTIEHDIDLAAGFFASMNAMAGHDADTGQFYRINFGRSG
jgi:hypothetical protein